MSHACLTHTYCACLLLVPVWIDCACSDSLPRTITLPSLLPHLPHLPIATVPHCSILYHRWDPYTDYLLLGFLALCRCALCLPTLACGRSFPTTLPSPLPPLQPYPCLPHIRDWCSVHSTTCGCHLPLACLCSFPTLCSSPASLPHYRHTQHYLSLPLMIPFPSCPSL